MKLNPRGCGFAIFFALWAVTLFCSYIFADIWYFTSDGSAPPNYGFIFGAALVQIVILGALAWNLVVRDPAACAKLEKRRGCGFVFFVFVALVGLTVWGGVIATQILDLVNNPAGRTWPNLRSLALEIVFLAAVAWLLVFRKRRAL